MSGVYVYAVTRSDHPLRLDGLRTVGGTEEPRGCSSTGRSPPWSAPLPRPAAQTP